MATVSISSGETAYPVKPRTVDDLQQMWPGTALEAFGLVLVEADDNGLVLEMPIRPELRQPMGSLHGGVHLFLAESAASLHACVGIDLNKTCPVGIEVNGSHLRPVREGNIRAVAKVIRRSRTTIVHRIEICHVESGKQLCSCRVTNLYRSATPGNAECGL
jgi:1,4-dihydroxy-2-naphthoyl-CoA hydrolase